MSELSALEALLDRIPEAGGSAVDGTAQLVRTPEATEATA